MRYSWIAPPTTDANHLPNEAVVLRTIAEPLTQKQKGPVIWGKYYATLTRFLCYGADFSVSGRSARHLPTDL